MKHFWKLNMFDDQDASEKHMPNSTFQTKQMNLRISLPGDVRGLKYQSCGQFPTNQESYLKECNIL